MPWTRRTRNITHRDLKPGNILVTKVGVKLLDFGLARVAASPDDTMTMAEGVMGTPAYMAPEQWEGKPGDARSGIYAFGCVLYEMLTGKRTAANREAVEPVAIDRVIRGCLEKDPEDRWQSARDLRRMLDVPLESLMPNSAAKRNPWPERAGWIATVVVLAGVVIGLAWRRSQPAVGELSRWTVYPPEGTAFAAPAIFRDRPDTTVCDFT
jgi:serine/threonine protein kinase